MHCVLKKRQCHYSTLSSAAELMTQHHAHSVLSNVIRYIYPKKPMSQPTEHYILQVLLLSTAPHWIEKCNKSQRHEYIINKGALSNIILTPTGLEACSMFTNCCHYAPICLSFFSVSLTTQIHIMHNNATDRLLRFLSEKRHIVVFFF